MRVKKKEQPSKQDYDECRRLREEHGAAQTPSSGSAAAFGGCGVLFFFSPFLCTFFYNGFTEISSTYNSPI